MARHVSFKICKFIIEIQSIEWPFKSPQIAHKIALAKYVDFGQFNYRTEKMQNSWHGAMNHRKLRNTKANVYVLIFSKCWPIWRILEHHHLLRYSSVLIRHLGSSLRNDHPKVMKVFVWLDEKSFISCLHMKRSKETQKQC